MKNLYAKLYKIQQLALSVSKDGKNPHFKSAYPTLDNTISVIIPEINKIGLLVTHFAEGDTFITRVVDIESGEALDSKYTLLGTTPQQRGSEQTYFRRYSMIALFNLPSEDDDGNLASTPKPKEIISNKSIETLISVYKSGEYTGTVEDALREARKVYTVLPENEQKIRKLFSQEIL